MIIKSLSLFFLICSMFKGKIEIRKNFMNDYLLTIKNLYQSYECSGKVIPLSFDFPSFMIDEHTFRITCLELLTDKLEYALFAKEYPAIEFQNVQSVEKIEKQLNQNTLSLMDKENYFLLERHIQSDNNMSAQSLMKEALLANTITAMKSGLMEIETRRTQKIFTEDLNYQQCLEKYVATLKIIENELPHVYRVVKRVIEDSPFKKSQQAIFDLFANTSENVDFYIKLSKEKKELEKIMYVK